MSVQLKLDEWLEAAHEMKHPNYKALKRRAETMVKEIADEIAAHAGVLAGAAEFEGMAFAGLCCPVYPAHDGQRLPDAFRGLDDDGADGSGWTL